MNTVERSVAYDDRPDAGLGQVHKHHGIDPSTTADVEKGPLGSSQIGEIILSVVVRRGY